MPSRIGILFLVAATWLQPATAAANATTVTRNGWYPCSINTYELSPQPPSNAGGPSMSLHRSSSLHAFVPRVPFYGPFEDMKARVAALKTQCASFAMPFCHDGVETCVKAEASTWPLFVKKMPASIPTAKKALIVLQGGPGASSVAMESLMAGLHDLLFGSFHILTIDHRGTGRSGRLDCAAATAQATGGPGGSQVTPNEMPGCLADLAATYGTTAGAFSITNAAKDLSMLIQTELADHDVYLYGVSYGTLLLERLLQFAPPQVKGVILDSIVADRFDGQDGQAFSNWNVDHGAVARQFLEDVCPKDVTCAKTMGTNGTSTLARLYESLDRNQSACSGLFYTGLSTTPSLVLRAVFAALLEDLDRRVFIPAIVARITRCNDEDKDVLLHLLSSPLQPSDPSEALTSNILHDTIAFAELWQRPTPTDADLTARFLASPMGTPMDGEVARFCMYTGANDTACAALNLNRTTTSWTYTPDKYFNKTAAVPTGMSVLGLTGNLDPITPSRHARRQFANMQGTNKRLLEFPLAVHGVISSTPMKGAAQAPPCGMAIVADYVRGGGKLETLDVSCMKAIAPLSFEISPEMALGLFGLHGAYDGAVSYPAKDADKFKKLFYAMIAALSILGVVLFGVAFYAFVKHREAAALRAKYKVYDDAAGLDEDTAIA
ncbi:Aste57867_469 [Aphanomyces stellatus]|uniref:Aste57867_469 protein n=1 Tax=Aphanomyces stellatus TaxID=120398 RepID=A0A485K6T9_9STRA|nr:hypothetical protein As57867_000468 [Aphanomyces stellatus]VFT77694.1 Aste57867_469 [Aphanomyces stellatus]